MTKDLSRQEFCDKKFITRIARGLHNPYKCLNSILIFRRDEMDDRIDALREAADKSGLTIDFLQWITQDLSRQAFLSVMGRASSIPSYMKSSDKPNVLRSAIAPSSDSL